MIANTPPLPLRAGKLLAATLSKQVFNQFPITDWAQEKIFFLKTRWNISSTSPHVFWHFADFGYIQHYPNTHKLKFGLYVFILCRGRFWSWRLECHSRTYKVCITPGMFVLFELYSVLCTCQHFTKPSLIKMSSKDILIPRRIFCWKKFSYPNIVIDTTVTQIISISDKPNTGSSDILLQ